MSAYTNSIKFWESFQKVQEELKKSVAKLLRLTGENYQCVITVERSYVGR